MGVNINTSFFNNASVYTWEAWVLPTDNSGLLNALHSEGLPQITFVIGLVNGALQFSTWNQNIPGNWTNIVTPTNSVPAGQWTHLACTMSNGQVCLYVNGLLSSCHNGIPLQSNSATRFAALGINLGFSGQDDYPFSGRMDEVRIWNRVLTQAEIRHKMTERLAGNEPGLVAYYRMDEGADGTCPGGQDVCDASGNANHGVKF